MTGSHRSIPPVDQERRDDRMPLADHDSPDGRDRRDRGVTTEAPGGVHQRSRNLGQSQDDPPQGMASFQSTIQGLLDLAPHTLSRAFTLDPEFKA